MSDHDVNHHAHVDRCICHDVRFTTLHDFAQSRDSCDNEDVVIAIRRTFGCGSGCGLCVPYIREMLRTGRTSLPVQLPVDQS